MSTPLPRVIPAEWLPKSARIYRVVMHWTAGRYTPSAWDKLHYHFLIGGDGKAVQGVKLPLPAFHTKRLNSNSVGISMCGMRKAVEGKTFGDCPITERQVERMCQAAADVIHAYDLALTPRTCLGHREVTDVYGIEQNRYDVDVLPFNPKLSAAEVREVLRAKVGWYLREKHGR